MAVSSAQTTALSTPEILECILLQLDLQTLITAAQRTCQTWTTLIRESPAIQKALFFIPMASPSPSDKKVKNPLLASRFPAFFQQSPERHPDLLTETDMFQKPEALVTYLRPEASWRRMLVQQPPALKLHVVEFGAGMLQMYTSYELPGRTDGLRMGEFFEYIVFNKEKYLLEHQYPSIVWWGNTCLYPRNHRFRQIVDNSDVLVEISSGVSSCMDDSEDDETPEDVILKRRIQSVYRELNMQPNPLLHEEKDRINVFRDDL